MNRMPGLRTVLFECSLIVLIGSAIAVVAVYGWKEFRYPTIAEFQRAYAQGDVLQQRAVAETYLKYFSPAELLQAIEVANADTTCHSQGHGIGRALYKSNPNFSAVIQQCGGSCTHGCFHGAMMEMFSTESDTLGGVIEDKTPESYLKHIQAVASELCTEPQVVSVVHPRFCTHGLGHVFAYFSPHDMDAAVHSCERLKTKFGVRGCESGVFMEYLFGTTSRAVFAGKGEAPCDRYPQYLQECYTFKAYGWLYEWGSVPRALEACHKNGIDANLCILTVAQAGANKKLMESDAGFEKLCGTLSGDERNTCITGAVLKIIDINNGDDTERLCDPVAPAYRNACLEELRSYTALMERET